MKMEGSREKKYNNYIGAESRTWLTASKETETSDPLLQRIEFCQQLE